MQTLSAKFVVGFGCGFSEKSLRHMMRFAAVFPNREIISALLRQLSWTQFLAIIYLKDSLQHDFYADMYRVERWGTRTLRWLEQQAADLVTLVSTRTKRDTQ